MTPEGVAAPARKPSRDETLVAALVRAHRWRRRIESGHAKSITDLAEQEGVAVAYVCRLLPLTCLAPDMVETILDGRQPKGLRLAEMLGNGPMAWEEQRLSWGFCSAFGGGSPRGNGRVAAGKKASALLIGPCNSAKPWRPSLAFPKLA
jgi:hypothetical protein